MLVLGGIVAAGTLYEARYNAQVAGLIVSRSWWFHSLLGLLWINIFFAALSRWPFKLHHAGFVITHIGLLTLLIGAEMTALMGIDGQLRIEQGETSNIVGLPELVLRSSREGSNSVLTFPVTRSLSDSGRISIPDFELATGLEILRYVPFVSVQQGFAGSSSPEAKVLRFKMESAFFNVEEALHSEQRPELQMGPAKIRFRTQPVASSSKVAASGKVLIIKKAGGDEVIARLSIKPGGTRSVVAGMHRITVTEVFEAAQVATGKLIESGQPGSNPALSIQIASATDPKSPPIRDVVFAKFPGFSLQPKATHGLRFEYQASPTSVISEDRSGNVIEFQKLAGDPGARIQVSLFKNGQSVLTQSASSGDTIQTPWMGMKLTLLGIQDAASASGERIAPIELQPKTDLPPAAVLIGEPGSPMEKATWVAEGMVKTIRSPQGTFEVYFGLRTVELPFALQLQEFRKTDYPGTDTAMSFQSTVLINGRGDPVTVQMNEPLQYEGFTVYQASYEMGQGRPTASIFSVNQDPGRVVKYLGALILGIGIILFTIMRSRYYGPIRSYLEEKFA